MSNKSQTYFKKVYDIVVQIPKGRVTNYGSIAAYLGMRSGARMVGWAMNHSYAHDKEIPAHRVVNRNGQLTGKYHFDHPGLMRELLENEGLTVINDRIQNYNDFFWDPLKELK
ncbi:MAG: MGMT family protein [Bacteroidales bacterium]|nr:MGMT family protein [Bacteroidales bacterium]